MFNIKKQPNFTQQQQEMNSLKVALKECEQLIRQNNAIFEMTVDDALIESRIYEMQSLNKHHEYLLNSLRSLQKQENKEKETVLSKT